MAFGHSDRCRFTEGLAGRYWTRVTGAGGAVTDSQSGFRALNRKAIQLLVGTLKEADFSIESEMMRRSRDLNLRMAEVQIQCRYGDFDTSAKNPVSHGVGVLGLGDPDHRRGWKRSCRWWQKTRGFLKGCE